VFLSYLFERTLLASKLYRWIQASHLDEVQCVVRLVKMEF